ncbi:MAG: hypothetical protein AAFX50_13555 [Acidobacteriota bacterium]
MLRCAPRTFAGLRLTALVPVLLCGLLALAWATPAGAQASALGGSLAAPAKLPELVFEAPPELEGVIDQLRRFDPASLAGAMALLGLEDPGPPIRVIVAPEGSDAAARAPGWAVAYAVGNAGVIVLIPNRLPTYPDEDLFQTLRHEVIHVLVARAAARRQVPRWFNEGLAMVGAHEWRMEDRGRLVLAAFRRRSATMEEVSAGFSGGGSAASSAYVVSASFVRYLLSEHGDDTAAHILERIAVGQSFPDAVEGVTNRSLRDLEKAFWAHLDLWNRWVPFLSSSAFVWLLATAVFLAAAARRRAKNAEKLREWEEEEAAELAAMPTDPWVN